MVFPYQLDLQYELSLAGRWSEGGVLEVGFANKPPVRIHLSRALWGVAAVLIHRKGTNDEQNGSGQFLTTNELAYLLAHHSKVGGNDPGRTIRFIHLLRQKLAASGGHLLDPDSHLSGHEWSVRLIEWQRFLGYRISLPPENLAVEVWEEYVRL